MKYRSRTEIMDAILRSSISGAKKTQIMYRAYLSVAQLNEYLRDLTEKQLIRYEEDSRIFRVTDRGIRFLNVYDEISELVTVSEERPFLKELATPLPSPEKAEIMMKPWV
jgi:predicted transcriptional regulator